jgi:hypothetical protein
LGDRFRIGKQKSKAAKATVARDDAEVIPLVTFRTGLPSWWVALKRRQFVSALHPFDPFGDLNVRSRRNGVRIIIGRALNVDDPRQHFLIGIEESGATSGAEMSPPLNATL